MIIPTSSDHNVVVVNGMASPGRAQVTGVKVPYNYDVQPGYGMSGATTVFKGRGIVEFNVTLTFWLAIHFVQWELFKKLLAPPSTFKPLVVEMRHPLLTSADVKAVAIKSIGEPERQGNGMWLAQIACIEWRPMKPAIVKPRGAIPSPEKAPVVTPKTEADLALIAAEQQFVAAKEAARRP